MALVLKDRVRESSTTSGTGSITLAGAYTGYQTFNSAIANGSTVYYTIHNTTSPNDNEWEVGVGTFTAPSTLSRDTVFSSSAGGSKVSFSSASVLEVFVTQPAEQAVYVNDATGKVEIFGNGTNTVTFTNINTTNLVANTVTLTAGTISTNAANATDITNKQYVDGLFSTGISYHDPVRVESPTALSPVTYNNGSSGVGATLTNAGTQTTLVIDGITLSLNDRVLIYTQTDQKQNGIYYVSNVGSGSTNWVLTRATDADTYGLADPNALGQGDAVFVQQGNTGAGETYICNTPGTIVFGTTNITFVQISSAQVYSAGTGLNLSNLTFSIANTTVTAATYGNAGQVPQIAVNAQGQITSASNVSINASSITLGTLDNARTTAASANGANTIVLRDSTGSFTANTITATTSNATTFNGTTGAFTNVSGNGSAISAINASNISTGTIANARTTANTANSANTIVARDADGSFGANIITATFSGNAAGLSAINASNISSGTIANARTTAASANGASTIVQRDSGGSFDANTVNAVSLIGNAAQVTNINASNISTGTIANARTSASSSNGASTIVLRGASGEFAAGAITGSLFTGNGSAISAINASNISTGTIDNARTTASSANGASTIVARDAGGNFAANTVTATTGSFTSVSGNGVALTAINASNIASGTIANARTTASDANGASTIVSRDANGSFSANIVTATFSGNGATLTNINASNISSGTIANARTTAASANGASTIVARDANGSFAGNVITGTTGTFTSISGNGSALTAINASNISSGTIANARTTAASANGASTIVARDASGNFTANAITTTSISGNGVALTAINASNIASGTLAIARGGTNSSATPTNGGVAYGNGTAYLFSSAGTSGQALLSAGAAAPVWTTLTMENIPGASYKASVGAATTAALTLNTAQTTIDGVTLSASTRVLVKNQATASQNGIYTNLTTTSWTRTADADTSAEIAAAIVNVDAGTVNGGTLYTNTFKTTDTLGTTAMNWFKVLDTSDLRTSGDAGTGAVAYNGTTAAAGQFYGGTTTPTGTTRLNYSGYFYPTFLNLIGSSDTATAASHYFVEQSSDGFVRPKTIANVRTEIVTTAAVNAALATSVGTITTGTWNAGNVTSSGNITGTRFIAEQGLILNKLTISTSYSIPSGYSASSVGPVTLSAGVAITVPAGSKWVVL